ncbi:HNH endonuclease signature motif containing protein [Knoellia sinensis]|nr:HNH endonuclease signature motif containing protein [Knoellia sinensis]
MDIEAVKTAMADLYAAIAAPASASSSAAGSLDADALLTVVEQSQQVINIASGIQTHAIAHLAAHDELRDDEAESGWAWKRHGLGFIADDTASLIAPRMGVSVPVAAGRVEVAVHQVTVTPRLVDAMGSGELDAYRAQLITREVMPCDDDIAREIVDRLLGLFDGPGGWSETAGPLGARTRRLVQRLAPEVAAASKEKAIKERALTRRSVSAAADLWNGLVPVEQSLVMWQAVDELARQLQRADRELTLEQARLDALEQLILQRADVTIHLHATHAESAASEGEADLAADDAGASDTGVSDAQVGDPDGTITSVADASAAGATKAAGGAQPMSGLAGRAIRGVVELGGLNRPGTTVVDVGKLPARVRLRLSTALTCHPDTGALIGGHVPKALAPCDLTSDPPPRTALGVVEERYRPSPALQRLIRLRDGHCRYPGCQIPARSCDIDHVVAWPVGPTTATNLMCLCRRHHRIKQLPGWSARLDPDGVVHWGDPGGRSTDTHPVDHLDRLNHDPVDPGLPMNETRVAAPHETTSATSDRTGASQGAPGRITPRILRRLLSEDPARPETLLELTLQRLLELDHVVAFDGPAPQPSSRPDWGEFQPPILIDAVARYRDDAPPSPAQPEPPPF